MACCTDLPNHATLIPQFEQEARDRELFLAEVEAEAQTTIEAMADFVVEKVKLDAAAQVELSTGQWSNGTTEVRLR